LERLGIPYAPIEVTDTARPSLAVKNSDDALFETYLQHANVTGYCEREARTVWALYKQLTDNKPLKDATRDDGRKLVAHFERQKIKSATTQKKIGWLTAAVNLAIKEGRLTFNPFSSIVPKRDDKQTRLPLDDADIRDVKRNLDRLDASDRLLFRSLATTGMRLSEAFEIDGEAKERGCRYVIVGKKTEQSERRVPLPAGVLAHLPKAIKGGLFEGDARAASKRLNRFLNYIGIVDPRKVVHSLRHRAQDRLRAAGCPEDMRWAIPGHEEARAARSARAARRRPRVHASYCKRAMPGRATWPLEGPLSARTGRDAPLPRALATGVASSGSCQRDVPKSRF
jgi:integrase